MMMSKEQIMAQMKATTYQAVALFGSNAAASMLESIINEIRKEQWREQR